MNTQLIARLTLTATLTLASMQPAEATFLDTLTGAWHYMRGTKPNTIIIHERINNADKKQGTNALGKMYNERFERFINTSAGFSNKSSGNQNNNNNQEQALPHAFGSRDIEAVTDYMNANRAEEQAPANALENNNESNDNIPTSAHTRRINAELVEAYNKNPDVVFASKKQVNPIDTYAQGYHLSRQYLLEKNPEVFASKKSSVPLLTESVTKAASNIINTIKYICLEFERRVEMNDNFPVVEAVADDFVILSGPTENEVVQRLDSHMLRLDTEIKNSTNKADLVWLKKQKPKLQEILANIDEINNSFTNVITRIGSTPQKFFETYSTKGVSHLTRVRLEPKKLYEFIHDLSQTKMSVEILAQSSAKDIQNIINELKKKYSYGDRGTGDQLRQIEFTLCNPEAKRIYDAWLNGESEFAKLFIDQEKANKWNLDASEPIKLVYCKKAIERIIKLSEQKPKQQ